MRGKMYRIVKANNEIILSCVCENREPKEWEHLKDAKAWIRNHSCEGNPFKYVIVEMTDRGWREVRRKKPERFKDWAYNNGRKRCGLPMRRKGSPKKKRHQMQEDVDAFIDYVLAADDEAYKEVENEI